MQRQNGEKIYRFSRNKFARVHPEYRRFDNSRLTYRIFHVDLSNNGRSKEKSLYIFFDFLIVLLVETLRLFALFIRIEKRYWKYLSTKQCIIQMIKSFSYYLNRKNLRIYIFEFYNPLIIQHLWSMKIFQTFDEIFSEWNVTYKNPLFIINNFY